MVYDCVLDRTHYKTFFFEFRWNVYLVYVCADLNYAWVITNFCQSVFYKIWNCTVRAKREGYLFWIHLVCVAILVIERRDFLWKLLKYCKSILAIFS